MSRRVVVTGMGAISPIGNDVPTMWKNMVDGVCGIETITAFDTSDLKVHIAGTVKDFDPTQYIEKKEVRKLDPYTQYAIAAAQQAVDDSGIIGKIDENRFGVYIGAGIGGLQTFVKNTVGMENGGSRKVSPFFIPMMIGNIATGNVAIRFNAKGASLSVMSACATGTNSIGEAFHCIKDGYADAIIAGGAEAVVAPLTIAGFQNMKALSTNDDPKHASRPFDKNRDGFIMGEGAGMLILEEYEHAVARGAKIYAELSGYGNTCDAHHITAPDPNGAGLARAIKIAFEEANVADDAQLYINAHGTSTHLNDLTETMAIKTALGEKAYDANISSTKSMTGHLLGATGAVEAIASVMALNDGVIPPTINLDEPDEGLDLNYTPNKAVKRDVNVAASTNLGFGGHDACLVFKKYSLSVLEIEKEDGTKIHLEKEHPAQQIFNASPIGAYQPTATDVPAPAPVQPQAPAAQSAAPEEDAKTVNAPIVGVFYAASAPGKAPFAPVGKKVSKGSTVCIIEAMKCMNEIQAEDDYEIVEVLVKDGDLVEYGQPLFKVK
mgnify:CR=1 FL=1